MESNLKEKINIRPFHLSDLTSIYKICLLTGNSGKDATGMYDDPDLLAHYYAAPYAVLEPELTFILTLDNQPCGYILGTKDSKKFRENCEEKWFPVLRERFPLPKTDDNSNDAIIINLLHKGYTLKSELSDYPAHLHIDLLPITQGKGLGRKMINVFINKLKSLGSPGLHLEVGKKNPGAIAFYKRMNFLLIKEYEYSIVFGMKLK